LLTPEAFHARGRGGFFELLDVFLKSSALPGYLAAAFIKRLARCVPYTGPHTTPSAW
jgi:U3 small nucleolar RNA-associated protein 19